MAKDAVEMTVEEFAQELARSRNQALDTKSTQRNRLKGKDGRSYLKPKRGDFWGKDNKSPNRK